MSSVRKAVGKAVMWLLLLVLICSYVTIRVIMSKLEKTASVVGRWMQPAPALGGACAASSASVDFCLCRIQDVDVFLLCTSMWNISLHGCHCLLLLVLLCSLVSTGPTACVVPLVLAA